MTWAEIADCERKLDAADVAREQITRALLDLLRVCRSPYRYALWCRWFGHHWRLLALGVQVCRTCDDARIVM